MLLNPLEKIVANLPYGDGFKFVDQLLELDEDSVIGIYRFRESEYFYKHHFKDQPVTPGVILIECMAQIGLACLGSYLMRDKDSKPQFVFTENHINFLNTVLPETTVIVSAKKDYFRFGKLKVVVQMMDENENKIAEGWMSGMILTE
ncbi:MULTISPECIES: 3-hydroxyacyl-ACP dehydratase FabZ family protein [Nonlabens]|uniref:3-hydroxyacyl-[acyl-carrier-protein] dehydratase n=1 Tax=Nonlabens xylanidelens TaxID=191564 RepID=A0A2S6IMZ2_9FLAO|nr:acyl carrier protein [Nonlabens xylanidelens]PPK95525.1 3-hydroxyacyl-[acyl-carrier-protein] dehydratase [Nonlabens xylanidelens]PQJ22337.1 acyl carrier protein [Nonlabens xylanidelens]